MFTPKSNLLDSIRRTLEQRSLLTARSRGDYVQALNQASKSSTPRRVVVSLTDKIKSEIISSEETYIAGLKQLQEFQTIGIEKSIFINLETIIQVNEKLLEDLKSNKENIGKAFIDYAPYLQHYSAYAGGFTEANRALQNLPLEVKSLIREKESEIGKSIQSLLITPIQRVPRYKLLMEQLIGASGGRNTRELVGGLKSLNTVAQHMNEFVRRHENSEKLIQLQSMVGSQFEILKPGRVLLLSGDVTKVTSGKIVHLLLTSDILIVTKIRGEVGIPGSLDVALVLPLKTMTVAMTDDFVELQCSPEIFRFTSECNLNWYEEIQDSIWTLRSKRATLKKPFSSVQVPIKRRNMIPRPNINFKPSGIHVPKCKIL